METTYEFSGYNREKIYGYGTETVAKSYLDWINKNLTYNLYEMAVSDLPSNELEIVASDLSEDLAYLIEAEKN